MPNVTIYIKNAIWTQIMREHNGDDLKARQSLKADIEGRYVKAPKSAA